MNLSLATYTFSTEKINYLKISVCWTIGVSLLTSCMGNCDGMLVRSGPWTINFFALGTFAVTINEG